MGQTLKNFRNRLLYGLFAITLTGCRISLPKDIYKLEGMESRCQDMDQDDLLARIRGFDISTPTSELHCALYLLRTMRASSIHETSAPSKVCYLLADRDNKRSNKERLASEGVRWAQVALDGAPAQALYGIRGDETEEEGRVNYYLAVNLGIAVHDHTALAIKNINRIVKALKKAIQLVPDEEKGGPLRVLGLLYLVAPPWPRGIGDGDKALVLLKQAVAYYPEHPLNHIFYAQALWEVEEDDAEQDIKREISIGDKLLADKRWCGAKARWSKLLKNLAKEADVNLVPIK